MLTLNLALGLVRRVRAVLLLLVIAPLIPISAAAAQAIARSCETTDSLKPTTLTVEGGGSLGVYEAGMTHVLVEVFRRKSLHNDTAGIYSRLPALCLSATTGASAGNINGFLAAMSWCSASESEAPERSTFWTSWISTGLGQLLPRTGEPGFQEGGLFSRRHFDQFLSTQLRSQWARNGWIPGCHIEFGATVTRLIADSVPGAGSIHARNQRLASAFTISGLAHDSTPIMMPIFPPDNPSMFGEVAPLLTSWDYVEGVERVPFGSVFQLVEVSSGYPVAFQPLELKYCGVHHMRVIPAKSFVCSDTVSAVALDGGVFDNGPISLAYSLFLYHHSGRTPLAIYLSPDHRRLWPGQQPDVSWRAGRANNRAQPYGLEEATQLVSEAVPTARQYELQLAGRMLPVELLRQELERDLVVARDSNSQLVSRNDILKRNTDSLRLALVNSLGRSYSLAETVRQLCRLNPADTLLIAHPYCRDSSYVIAGAVRPDTAVRQQGLPAETQPRSGAQPVSIAAIPGIPQLSVLPGPDSIALRRGEQVGARAIDSLDQQFRATARWHPLAGDWLASFGAFLGRPLREYDFYVGMYDALALISENILCAQTKEASESGSDAARGKLKQCVALALAGLLEQPPIPLGPVASRVLPALYRDEFGADSRLHSVPAITSPLTASDSTVIVMNAVRAAMNRTRMPPDLAHPNERHQTLKTLLAIGHCRRPAIIMSVFCESNLVAFLDALQSHSDAVEIMRQWSSDAACSDERAVVDGEGCRAEPRFVEMVNDPEGTLYDVTRQTLSRLETVTPRGGMARRTASALVFLNGSSSGRHRRGFDLGETALPENMQFWQRLFFYALPSSIMLTPNISGWGEVAWEGRAHLGTSPFAFAIPLRLRPFSEIGFDGVSDRTLLVPGARLEYKAAPYNTRVGIEDDLWFRPYDGLLTHGNRGHTMGLFVSAAGKVNLTWTGVPHGLTIYRQYARIRPFGQPSVLSAGIGDFNGDLYWLWRLIRG